jgi:hypothetical protein
MNMRNSSANSERLGGANPVYCDIIKEKRINRRRPQHLYCEHVTQACFWSLSINFEGLESFWKPFITAPVW